MSEDRTKATAIEDMPFRLLIDAVIEYAIYMIDSDGIITSWNSGAKRFKGYEEAEILGQHLSRFYTEEDRRAGLPQRALDTAIREGRFENKAWRVRKDGTRFLAHVVVESIWGDTGTLLGFAAERLEGFATRFARLSKPFTQLNLVEIIASTMKWQARSMLGRGSRVLLESTYVHGAQAKLQHDQCISLGVVTPDRPQNIADNKADEARDPAPGALRTNQPRRQHRDQHRWPLHPIEIVHPHSLASAS